MLKHALEMKGYNVVEAIDGCEAVRVAKRELPDLILMDLTLPILGGAEATSLLREHEELRHVPIIAITAHDSANSRANASDAGCNGYLTKPIDFDYLAPLINGFLSGGQRLNTPGGQ